MWSLRACDHCDDRLCEQCYDYEDNAGSAPDNSSSHVVNNGENNARNSTTAKNNSDSKPCKKPTSDEHLRMSDECSDADDGNICMLTLLECW